MATIQMFPSTLHGHSEPEPIGLEYIGASLFNAGIKVNFRNRREIHVSVPGSRRTLAMFSAVTPEYNSIIPNAINARKKGYTTVLGGYHACGASNEVLDGPFDYIVIGEGERVSVALAETLLMEKIVDLPGVVANGEVYPRQIVAGRIDDLDALPFPLRFEKFLGAYKLHDLMWPPASMQRNGAIVLASRGCKHQCDFCASATVWGHGVKFRSPKNVVEELQNLKERFGTDTIVFIDQSLGQEKKWTLNLCRAIQEAGLGMHWYHQSNLTIDRNVLRAMADTGCTKIGFGLEGVTPKAAERIKPPNPHDFEEINSLFDYCNSLGLFVKAYLMIGFPWETEKDIREYLKSIGKIRANEIKISYFTPFPGTRAWECYSNSLISKNWADFDTVAIPVVYNPNIPVEKYHTLRHELFRAFYGSNTYAEVTKQMLTRWPHYVQSYREFLVYLQAYDMVSGEEVWLDWIQPSNCLTIPNPNYRSGEIQVCR